MPYLIDSDVTIAHLAKDASTMQLLDRLANTEFFISMISYMEVLQGILASADPAAAEAQFDVFLADVPVVLFSIAIARRCAVLREQLSQQGRRVRSRALDLMIAATALDLNLVLVTRNLDDYDDIPELRLYHID